MKRKLSQKGLIHSLSAILITSALLSACSGNPQMPEAAAPDVDFLEVKPALAHEEKKYPGAIEGTVISIKRDRLNAITDLYRALGAGVE
ncbi:hypothetical protein ACJVDH_12665 [Pedobacter sp. AW1-32]|uniref:hypothetical protein n=1 Tax=Pedobacter sp. AW1-32 TaxID=3383026 RepID=UPI003FEEC656